MSETENRALDPFARAVNQEYTPQDYFKEARALRKAGFTDAEIEKLRRARVLHPDAIMFGSDAPAEMAFQQVRLKGLDGSVLHELKKDPGLQVSYVRDSDGVFHYVPDLKLENMEGKLLTLEDGKKRVIVMEAGTLSYSAKQGAPQFQPRYRVDPDMPENAEAFAKLRQKEGFENVVIPKEKPTPGVVTLNCMEAMSNQAKGKGFIASKMAGSAALSAIGLVATEPFAHRLDSESGRSVMMADFTGSLIASGITGALGRHLVQNGASGGKAYVYRLGTTLGIVAIQNPIYKKIMESSGSMDEEEARERANAIAKYDLSYQATKALFSHQIDKAFIENLPYRFYDACKKRPTVTRLVLTPGMIRFYESGVFSIIYYGGRSLFVGQ